MGRYWMSAERKHENSKGRFPRRLPTKFCTPTCTKRICARPIWAPADEGGKYLNVLTVYRQVPQAISALFNPMPFYIVKRFKDIATYKNGHSYSQDISKPRT